MPDALHAMRSSTLAITLSTLCHVALATEPVTAAIEKVELTATGPSSAGTIQIAADVHPDKSLKLKVVSSYGAFVPDIRIENPHLDSLAVEYYFEDPEMYTDLFTVCLWYGERATVNLGTKEEPEWEHKYNKIT